ncbi:MAG: hypothetical protein Q7J78_05210 [Clostridiales bacterium]|nr:hypothetical protein [Clostridiales bacterium]
MILSGKLFFGQKRVKEEKVLSGPHLVMDHDRFKGVNADKTSATGTDMSFRDQLEDSFLKLCKQLDISVPLWLDKNTREFAAFRKTIFFQDQFNEDAFAFDRFEIKLEKL